MSNIYSQNFDGVTAPALPSGWAAVNGAWSTTTSNAISSPNGLIASDNTDGDTVVCSAFTALGDLGVYWEETFASNAIAGIILRCDSALTKGYVITFDFFSRNNSQIYYRNGGSYTSLGSQSNSAWNSSIGFLGGGSVVAFRAKIVGNTLYYKWWNKSNAEPAGWAVTFTDTSNHVTGTGYFGFYNQVWSGTSAVVDNVSVDNLATASLSITSPSSVSAGATGVSVTLAGTGTAWTAGTPGSPTFTALGGTITAQTVSSATAATLTFNAPSSAGTVTITDPTGGTATLTINAAPTLSVSTSPASILTGSTGDTLTLTGSGTSWTSGTNFMVSGGTITAKSVASANSATLTYSAPSSAATITLTDTSTGATTTFPVVVAASNFSVAPPSLTTTAGVATGNYTVTLNGGLASNETIALSDSGGGGTFSSPLLTFTPANAGTAQTFTYTPASGAGGTTKTLTLTGSGAFSASQSASCVVSSGPTVVAINDPNLFISPYNWHVNGSSYACSQAAGAYMRLGFTGTSIKANLLNTASYPWTDSGSVYYDPVIVYSIDGGAVQSVQLNGSPTQITLATGLASGSHKLWLAIRCLTGGYDKWGTLSAEPLDSVTISGFTLDAGASSVAPTLNSKRILFFGDSITEGVKTLGNASNVNGDIVNNDAQYAWPVAVAQALGAEYGVVGYGGQGWVIGAAGGGSNQPPGLFQPSNPSWSKYSAYASRLVSGQLSPAPDYIFVMLGTNDRSISGTATPGNANYLPTAVSGFLAAVRAAAPNAWIFLVDELCSPAGGSSFSTTAQQRGLVTTGSGSGFGIYQAATPDSKCKVIATGIEDAGWFSEANAGATQYSADGIHPNQYFSPRFGAQVAAAAQKYIDSGGGIGGGRSRLFMGVN